MRKAQYTYKKTTLLNKKIAIVIDLDNDHESPSVTNDIENITKELKTDRILYQGSDGIWFYWNGQYIPILEETIPVYKDEEKAQSVLTKLFHSNHIE